MGSKTTREPGAGCKNDQGAEESNLGGMEYKVCHKIMVFYMFFYLRHFSPRFARHFNTVICQLYTSGLIFNSGSKFTNVKGAGRYQNRFGKHEKLFWGASRK